MTESFFTVDRRPDGVAVITLSRPKANALSVEVLRQLEVTMDDLAVDPPGAVVIWGGTRIFAAGADIAEFRGGVEQARRMARSFAPPWTRWPPFPG